VEVSLIASFGDEGIYGITAEFTRPRDSGNVELQKLLEKHAIAARVQRFVIPPRIVTRHASNVSLQVTESAASTLPTI
jgi:hypothetical protein